MVSGQNLQLASQPFGYSLLLNCLLICISLLPLSWHTADAQEPAYDVPPATGPIDFAQQILPILQSRCIKCHGPDKQEGDLRLDEQVFVDKGGHTGNPILGDSLETSELYLRITSDEDDYRMPKGEEPLPDEEIANIKAWIEEGALWPELPKVEEWKPSFNFWIWLDETISQGEAIHDHVWPVDYPFVILLLVILVLERAKVLHSSGHRLATGRAAPVFARLAGVRTSHYLVAVTLLFSTAVWLYYRGKNNESEQHIAVLRSNITKLTHPKPITEGEEGKGPKPIRPKHPRRLQGTYYRGNDERSDRLFNGGYYRTATFRIWLCGDDGIPLTYSDQICGQPIRLAFELTKANQATNTLFSDRIMQQAFLSQQIPEPSDEAKSFIDRPVPLDPVEEGERWIAYYPIGVFDEQQPSKEGMIYVYQGKVDDGVASGTIHYGIGYHLATKEGQFNKDSEIWMGCVFVLSDMVLPPQGRIPVHEWFDFRAIPEIESDNTDDPVLLGIPEHIPSGAELPDQSGEDAKTKSEPNSRESSTDQLTHEEPTTEESSAGAQRDRSVDL